MSSTSRQPLPRQSANSQPINRQPLVLTDKPDGVFRPIPVRTNATTTPRRAELANNQQKRQNDLSSLALSAVTALDREQVYANPGDTLPIVFCREEDGIGGAWISPPLASVSSSEFTRNLVYVLSAGRIIDRFTASDLLIGKETPARFFNELVTVRLAYTDSEDVCPLEFAGITCNSDSFKFAARSLPNNIGWSTNFRLIDNYAKQVTISVSPRRDPALSVATDVSQYRVEIYRMGQAGVYGDKTLVGEITTPRRSDEWVSFTDTPTSDTYFYELMLVERVYGGSQPPVEWLVEVEQVNEWPDDRVDRNVSYRDITFLVIQGSLLNTTFSFETDTLQQLHAFCRDGVSLYKWRYFGSDGSISAEYGSSNNFADLLYYFGNNSGLFAFTDNVSPINEFDVAEVAQFTERYKMLFNGVIAAGTNFLSWAQQVAPLFLSAFYADSSYLRVCPLLPLNDDGTIQTTAITPVMTFSDADTSEDSVANSILVGSYQKSYINVADRKPFKAIITWLLQEDRNLEVTRTVTALYDDYPANAPEEVYDMSSFGSTEEHAILLGKYLLASRRYPTHTITFSTAASTIDQERGTYLALYDVIAVSLGRVNSAGDNIREIEYYLVTNITFRPTGLVDLEAEHFPVDASNRSVIANSIVSGAFTIQS